MKTLKLLLFVPLMLFLSMSHAQEQTQTEINQKAISESGTGFRLTGYGFTGYEIRNSWDGLGKIQEKESNFGQTSFAPIFLWKASDKLFFEGELEFGLEGDELEIALEYADINYIFNKYVTLRAGKFLTPFGAFQEKLHPAWINKVVDKPLGFGHDAVGPSTEVGAELRGAVQLGASKINYSLYVSNGPSLQTDDPDEAGMLKYENSKDNNLNKAVGGRIGLLPFSNSSTEIGFSGQTATVGTAGDSLYEDTKATMMAVDFSFVRPLEFIKCIIDIKGQFNQVVVDKKDYIDPTDTAGTTYTFDNTSQAYYAQIALRPSMLRNKFLKKTELVGRYSAMTLPEDAKWGEEETQITIGLNYWFTWRSALKFNYQIINEDGKKAESAFLIQWALGF